MYFLIFVDSINEMHNSFLYFSLRLTCLSTLVIYVMMNIRMRHFFIEILYFYFSYVHNHNEDNIYSKDYD